MSVPSTFNLHLFRWAFDAEQSLFCLIGNLREELKGMTRLWCLTTLDEETKSEYFPGDVRSVGCWMLSLTMRLCLSSLY